MAYELYLDKTVTKQQNVFSLRVFEMGSCYVVQAVLK
jgi:hypothetical protein